MRRFCFALARELGMTVRQLLVSLDSAELSEWLAFYQLEAKGAKTQTEPDPNDINTWKRAWGA